MDNEIVVTDFEEINTEENTVCENPPEKKKKDSKFRSFINENKFILAASGIAAIVMIFVYMVYKFYPIGTETILRMDLYHQYGPLFAEFYERVKNFDSFLYSWCSGGGSSFLGNYLNYLSSPANIVMLIAGHENMPEAIAVMILLKNAFAAGSFAYFIKKTFKRNDITITGFGILYAFCGWFMAYYWNLMWIDGMMIMPLVMLGIQYIVANDKRKWLYGVALCYAMLTSYYMAYMLCLISVVYFLYCYFSKYEMGTVCGEIPYTLKQSEYKRLPFGAKIKVFYRNCLNSKFITSGCTFAYYSILAFLVAAFALVPLYFILNSCSATGSSWPSEYKTYFNLFDFIANHLAGAEPTIRSSGDDVLPNIYTGILPLILAPLFFFSKKYSFKEKTATVFLFAFFYFSFNTNYLNFVWHGFHFPNDLPFRQSFAYSFFLLLFAYKAFDVIDEFSNKQIAFTSVAVVGIAVLAQKITSKNVDDTVVLESIIFATIYALVLIAYKHPKYVRAAMSALLVCCMITEVIVVDTDNFVITQSKEYYTNKLEDFNELKAEVDELEGENSFYRMELSDLLTRMDTSWYYYNGVSVFSSMAYESVAKLQRKLGMYGNDCNSSTYSPQTAVYNGMWNIKYVFDNANLIHNDILYDNIDAGEYFTVYKNNYCLPLAYCVSDNLAEYWVTTLTNPFDVQEAFFKYTSGVKNIFETIVPTVSDTTNLNSISESELASGSVSFTKTTLNKYANLELTLTPSKSGNLYLYMSSSSISNIIAITDEHTYQYNIATSYILDMGHVDADSENTLTVEIPDDDTGNSGTFTIYAVIMDEDEYIKGYNNIMSNGAIEVDSFDNGTHIGGSINAKNDSLVYTSIPYDEGWTITIDGVALAEKDYVKIGTALLGFNITAGQHYVEFDYTPTGLYIGVAITLATALIIAAYFIIKKRFADKYSKVVRKLTAADFTPFDYIYSDEELEQQAAEAEAENAENTEEVENAVTEQDADITETTEPVTEE